MAIGTGPLGRPRTVATETSSLHLANDTAQSIIILRMGGFHTLSCFIACVGKCWRGDVGLLDFLVASGVYAASTADQMFAGKQFNRALRGLTLAYETFTAMKLAAFVAWCERSGGSHVVSPVVWRQLDAQQANKFE